MRYEDASQTGSGQVDARNDADQLAARDYGTASGNVITGTGTVSGSAGLDMVDAGQGRITAIDGAGGSDSSFSGGKLSVQGQYGTLAIDARGNYTYDREAGTPAGVTDTFHYTLANKAGATDSARLVISFGEQPKLADATRVVPGPDGVVTLPPGVELSDIRVVGRDLVVTLPDGSLMIIVDGAIFVPQLVLGGVEVPATNLAALLIGSEPRPAAGDLVGPTNPSSGGNFEVPVAPLDPGVPLGDLLPPTELDYTPPEFEELGDILDDNDPPVIGTSAVNVSEEGVISVAAPNPDDAGSPDTTNSPSNSGVLPVSDPDGDALNVVLGTPSEALTSAGVAITWSVSPDGHTLTGSAGGNTVITVVINDVGAYTVTLLRPVDHPTAGGEQGTSFVVPVSVSDGEEITTGGAITVTIEDDSPTIAGRIGEPILIVDDGTLGVNDTDSFTGAFLASFGADGAAAANSISYALGVTAGPSGIIDVATGEQVNLVMNGGVVEGRTATTNLLVFTVSVDGSGNVTLDQIRAVQHNDPADPVETGASAATLASDSLVTLRIVATDRDGDTASLSVNIGQNLQFEDDGPSISVIASLAEPFITVDETVLATNASASFAGLFNGVYGADGAGTTSYALAVTAGASGLVDVATGETILLSLVNGVVQGRTSGSNDLVFTVSIDANGVVSLDQIRAIQHSPDAGPDQPATLSADNLVRVVATITDRDGDVASAAVNIGTNLVFEDDGPSLGSSSGSEANILVDETNLAANASASFAALLGAAGASYGADGAGTTVYALNVSGAGAASGLFDVATGNQIYLYKVGDTIVGRVGSGPATADPAGTAAFVVSVDANGVVTLDQVRALTHPNTASNDEPIAMLTDGLISLSLTVTDRDGDAVSASVNIASNLVFEDDGPSLGSSSGSEANILVDETNLAANASASFAALLGAAGASYGADGAGTTVYALNVSGAGTASGLFDVATGNQIYLYKVGDTIVGRVGSGPATADPAGTAAFVVSVDANGVVTLDQVRALTHPNTASNDEPIAMLTDGLISLSLTVTDRDGDAVSASVNIASNLVFEDDGPSLGSSSGSEANILVDETNLAANASASFAALLGAAGASYGADGAGTTVYALNVSGAGAASGLFDVATGNQIYLYKVGDTIVGRVGSGPATADPAGTAAFVVSVDANGVVTLDQVRALTHPNTASNDEPIAMLTDGLISLSLTVTDRDGDAVSASVNIASNLVFEDDGPSLGSSSGSEANILVDETNLAANASASFAALLGAAGASYGADGAGTTVYALNVSGAGTASGLFDVATGNQIYLYKVGDTIVGRVGSGPATADPAGTAAFVVSVDANGVVTLDQVRALTHPNTASNDEPIAMLTDGLISLSLTVTDRDGDAVSASVNIASNLVFEDDGPSLGSSSGSEANILVDETNLAANASASFAALLGAAGASYGADGAGTTVYALNVSGAGAASGLFDVATGNQIYLYKVGDTIVGRVGSGPATADPAGTAAFVVSVDANGVVTLDQVRALTHPNTASNDEPIAMLTDGLISLSLTVTDRDGDAVSASVNIASNLVFEDDGPSLGSSSGSEANILVDETNLAANASASFAALLGAAGASYGADGAGTTVYALNVSGAGTASGLFDVATGNQIYLYKVGDTIVGRVGSGPATADPAGTAAFVVSVDANGVVTLDQVRALTHPNTASNDEPIAMLTDGLISLSLTVTDRDGDAVSASVNIASNLVFEDDGPSLGSSSGSEANILVDETNLAANASASFAALLGAAGASYGADGAGTTVYALNVSGAGAASGLFDVATGNQIYLYKVGDTIVGRVGSGPATADPAGTAAFVVSVDANGVVTLDQVRALTHPNTASNDEPIAMLTDGLISLSLTVTDRDGDAVSASVNIASNLVFEDDGPSLGSSSGSEANILVDETNLAANASASFAALLGAAGASYGADGAGTTVYALNVSGAGTASGLFDVATGNQIYLYKVGDTIVGRVGSGPATADPAGTAAFVVSVDANGVVTLDQVRALTHPNTASNDEPIAMLTDGLISLSLTVTDRDGDAVSASVNIASNLVFEDDGPSSAASGVVPNLVVDEFFLATDATQSFAGVFLAGFGADGPSGNPVTYSLGVIPGASGLIDVATGQTVILSLNGTVVEGRTSGSNALVFTVTVAANGDVTLDQLRAVVHNDPADPDEPGASAATLSADNLVTLTATVTDKDGDSATVTIDIGQNLQFEDDGPSVVASGVEPILNVDETVLGTNASMSFAGLFIPNFGADGAAAVNPTTYALAVTAGPSGLIDVATGQAVNLVMNGTTVEGRTAIGNQLVFTVTVDANGLVTLDQQRAVQHNDPADPDEPGALAAVLTADNLIRLTATVTDRDGDTATATINIGSNLQFEDDGPSVVASGVEPILNVDETVLGTNASMSFAGLFIPNFGADGAAAVNPTTYALAVTAGPSGLIDVATGQAVNLVMNGTTVEGRTAIGNQLVFTVTVDANGLVTLDQQRAVQHNDPADPDEPGALAAVLTADNLIRLTATVTDRDGDTATATINIGSNLQFEDDGPSVVASGVEPILNVDETVLGTNASMSFAGLFIPNFGADGAAAVNPTTYALAVTAGPSGLIDVATGQAVNLVMNGTTVEGRTAIGNQLVFTVTVDANGLVTLDQQRAVQHNDPADPDEPGALAAVLTADNLIRLTATVTDRDGDTATATINIGSNLQFEDDGPSVVASGVEPILNVDETVLGTNASMSFAGLFIPNFGADGAAAVNPTTYALAVTAGPSGLIDVATGQAVNLVMNGTTVEGRTAIGNQLVFTVTVDANGLVTLDQQRAVQHNDPADPDEPGALAAVLTADNLIRLTATVTDRDGDTATATINIGSNLQFEDDGPSVVASGVEPILNVDETVLGTNASMSFAGLFIPNFGADGAAAVNPTTYALAVTAGPSGLIDVATGQAVNLVMNGTTVEGRTAIGNQLVFTVTVDANGLVTLDQQRAVQHNDPADPDEPGALAAVLTADNLIRLTATVTDRDGDTATATINIGSNLQFEDDGPSVVASGVEPILNVDETVLGTNASMSFAGLFIPNFGADGAAAVNPTTYALAVTAGPSGLIDVATGQAVNLVMNGTTVEGRTAIGNQLVFTVTVDANGLVTLDQQRAVQHNDPADPDEPGALAAVLTADNLIRLTATVTDRDGDTATATINIGSNLQFEDDGPTITTVTDPLQIDNDASPSGTGSFVFSVGADANGDFDDISVSGFTVLVNGIAATNIILTPDAAANGSASPETATTASYDFSFQYDTGTGGTATAEGTLVFNKALGTYTVTLTNGPISGFTILETGNNSGTTFVEYDLNGGAPDVVTAQLADNLFAQFTAVSTNNNGTPNLLTSGGSNTAWNPGELFIADPGNPQVSSTDAGVDGNTMDTGEVLDFDLFTSDPGSNTAAVPNGFASEMFIQFFQFAANDDIIIILKLQDANDPSITTTRAIIVNSGDVFTDGDTATGTAYEGLVAALGSQDGLVVIQSNDYNADGENWVIVGAQIVTDNDGTSGTGVNLNGDLNGILGTEGASDRDADGDFGTDSGNVNLDELETFAEDTDTSGLKITSIGFLVPSTTAQDVTIEFDVTVTDGDGDTVVQNDITVNIGDFPPPPVVLDLDGDGVEFLSQSAGVAFDYGDGLVATAWAGSDDGILVRDANGDGQVEASEFVFGGNGVTDMEALHAQYGEQLDASDADFVMFAVWNDANSNGIADDGELSSLAEAGIASIGLVSDGIAYTAANGDVSVAGSSSFTRTDGSTGIAADAAFRTGSRVAVEADRVAANSNNVVLAAALAAAGLAASTSAAASTDASSAIVAKSVNPVQVSEGIDLSQFGLSTETAISALLGGAHGIGAVEMPFHSSSAFNFGNGSIGELAGGGFDASAPISLPQASDFMSAPMAMPMMASNVAMPSAEALVAMAGLDAGQSAVSVDSIVASALQGGGGPDIDALLSALPGQGIGADAALDALTSLGNGTVPSWDMGQGAGFTFAGPNAITTEALVLHHDAIQPIANG